MRLWRRRRRGADGEPISDRERLEELLHRLADDIAAEDDGPINRNWSRQVRTFAAQVGAGQPAGLEGFLRLFSNDPRNTINDQRFAGRMRFFEARGLAERLLAEHQADERVRRAAEREVVVRPWNGEGPGKAAVYADGTVVTSADDADGEPGFEAIKDTGQRRSPVALVVIATDGSCAAHRLLRDEPWVAAELTAHDPRLRLGSGGDGRL